VVVVITPVSLFVAKFITGKTYKFFKGQSEISGRQTAMIEETLGNLSTVKAYAQEDEFVKKFGEVNDEYKKTSFKAVFFSSLTNPVTRFVNSLVYSSVALSGALLALKGGSGAFVVTAGSILVILQAAFPTVINFIILVVIGGILSNFVKTIKKYERKIKNRIQNQQFFKWESKDVEIESEALPVYDELESNLMINNAKFYFITSPSMKDKKYEIIKLFHSEVIVEKNKKIINSEPEKAEYLQLIRIKDGKDECLIKLLSKIKKAGGNGILDLSINYSLIGFSGENIQITAMGIGILIED
jgi:ABC-type multidrug transport system fused ATPase/permease subunit